VAQAQLCFKYNKNAPVQYKMLTKKVLFSYIESKLLAMVTEMA
jgi:hypothetical protein